MLDAYIYDGLRTPFGRHGGALAPVRPDDLLAFPALTGLRASIGARRYYYRMADSHPAFQL